MTIAADARTMTASRSPSRPRSSSTSPRRPASSFQLTTDDFTVADVVMAGVLRMIRKTDMLKPFPQLLAYYERCFARPAWRRALAMYAERVGVTVDDIR